ncbi:hypothetical protein [Paraburkholderia sp.]|uniref:hypothetical protein n=1 Tax=Paraburkholderia sp. TaxID=1926495 RepID=UPI002D3F2426|nr:hypothetical protein [Paraburkholderia sp.]HZZ06626.1 hypothetical protein [Paraburkholderia sp.]
MRDSHRGDQRANHLVSAYGSDLGMALGRVRTADKSNEITKTDAMGRQRCIAGKIVQTQAD